jgi:hypothetical protein
VCELLRVLRAGGLLVLAAPDPQSMTGHVLELAQDGPARLPRGVPSPTRWGLEDVALDRIFAVAPDTEVETRTHALALEFESEAAAWEAYSAPFGLSHAVRDRFADLVAMRSETTDRVRISEWLTIVVARRAGIDPGPGRGEPLS